MKKERKLVTPAYNGTVSVNTADCGGVRKPRQTYFISSVGKMIHTTCWSCTEIQTQ